MPSLQSKLIVVLLRLMGMKRTVNRLRQRVEKGERTYTEPSPFLPDCRKLRERAAAESVTIDYREYADMVHDWMLGPLPESKQVLRGIVDLLQ